MQSSRVYAESCCSSQAAFWVHGEAALRVAKHEPGSLLTKLSRGLFGFRLQSLFLTLPELNVSDDTGSFKCDSTIINTIKCRAFARVWSKPSRCVPHRTFYHIALICTKCRGAQPHKTRPSTNEQSSEICKEKGLFTTVMGSRHDTLHLISTNRKHVGIRIHAGRICCPIG